jgi:cbb3-type cytochrome oxidase maturation protein
MSVIFLLIPLSIILAAGFLLAFAWAVTSGQYEDTKTPSMRVLLDEPAREPMTGSSLKAGHRTGSPPINSNKT